MLIFNKKKQDLVWLSLLFLMILQPLAWGSGDHPGGHENQKEVVPVKHGEHHGSSHTHSQWISPPVEYAGKQGTHWFDQQYIARGAQLYQENCVSCHGKDGKGSGVMAASLEHPPADLTHHFHPKPGKNDDYLFWRVSEGGQVAPFVGMKSAMPAFKEVLNEEARWSVLAYVHSQFHIEGANMCVQGEGTVNAVDREQRRVNMAHGTIPALGWPPMSMNFVVWPTVNLDLFKAGQKIGFCLTQSGENNYEISGVFPLKY